jgi:hypothetical protein
MSRTNDTPTPSQISWAQRQEAATAQLDKEWNELGERIDAAITAAGHVHGHESSLNVGKRPRLAADIGKQLIEVRQIMHDWHQKRRRRHKTD